MRKSLRVVAGMMALLMTAAGWPANSIPVRDMSGDIGALIKEFEARERFSGVVLVARDGEVLFRRAFGKANREWEIPNTVDTKFRIGSITKSFTAFLVLRLVEQGKIRLEGKLLNYLPDYRRDTGSQITIHHLLTHTSGLPMFSKNPLPEGRLGPIPVKEFVAKYCSDDLGFEPGSGFLYSNCGYFLLGAVIEAVTGESYEACLDRMILKPAGMSNTGYDHPERILPKRASGYGVDGGVLFNARYQNMSIPFAAGALYSTVDDFLLWDRVLDSGRLLSKRLTDVMLSPHVGGESYGYGWYVTKDETTDPTRPVTVCSHGGGITQFNGLVVRRIEEKVLIVILGNVYGARLGAMSRGIVNILHDRPSGVTFDGRK